MRESPSRRVLPILLLLATPLLSSCVTVRGEPRTIIDASTGGFGDYPIGSGGEDVRQDPRVTAPRASEEAVGKLVRGGLVGSYMNKQAAEMKVVLDAPHRVVREQERLTIVLESDALFRADGISLNPAARGSIAKLAAVMNRFPRTLIAVRDERADTGIQGAAEPQPQARARVVANVILAAGVSPVRVGIEAATRTGADGVPSPLGNRIEIYVWPDAGLRQQAAEHGY